MTINKIWHSTNKMAINATIEQRITWHTEHLKNCQCRTGYPTNLKIDMKKRGLIYNNLETL